MADVYDVFVSYAHVDGGLVKPLVAALRNRGLRLWLDEGAIESFESITRGITEGLANAKALVAVYSDTYPTRRPCQWELTAAFIAGQHDGDPRRRVLVINPEDHVGHIHPVELRDALFPRLPRDGDEARLAAVAEAVREASSRLTGALSSVRPMSAPPWHGAKGLGSNRFVGRVADMWKLHTSLFANDVSVITGHVAQPHAQVRGLGGVGKSLMAEEYALRFGAAYPGGVFVLKGTADLDDQIAAFAARFGLDLKGLSEAQIEGWLQDRLRQKGEPFLWLVDDLAGDKSDEERRRWLAPDGLGKTIITTRSREYDSTGAVIDLGVLDADEAYALLVARRKPDGHDEERAAREIVRELGGLALAIDVAGGALRKLEGRQSMADFLTALRTSGAEALDRVVKALRPDLPNGHERSIAKTLLGSIELLDEAGRDFLRLAAVLGPELIPHDL
jgi:hypothetical protein